MFYMAKNASDYPVNYTSNYYSGHTSMTTTDHDEIRQWAEARGGMPAVVEDTDILQIDFGQDENDKSLQEISWEKFFEIFDDRGLVFLYQEATSSGDESRFFEFVSEDTGRKAERS
jgi:hypothetical protein